jgi:intracellular septation protein
MSAAIPIEAPMTVIAPSRAPRLHPLVHAGRWIIMDLLSTLIFVGLFALTHSVFAATGLAIAGGALHIAWLKARRAPVDAMQWMSLGLVVVFGGASLATRDPRFIMLKPTLIYAAVGAVMLRRGWMNRYVPPVVLDWGADVTAAFGYVWAALMFATGAANLYLVAHGDPKAWAWFLGVFPLASKLVLVAVQYPTTRFVVVGRKRAAKEGIARNDGVAGDVARSAP